MRRRPPKPNTPKHFISGEQYDALADALQNHATQMREDIRTQLDKQLGQAGRDGISRAGFDAYYAVLPDAVELTARKVRGTNNPERLDRKDVNEFARKSAQEAWEEASPALEKHGFNCDAMMEAARTDATVLAQMCGDVFRGIARGESAARGR